MFSYVVSSIVMPPSTNDVCRVMFRLVNLAFACVFLASAALQYNDSVGVLWAAVYLIGEFMGGGGCARGGRLHQQENQRRIVGCFKYFCQHGRHCYSPSTKLYEVLFSRLNFQLCLYILVLSLQSAFRASVDAKSIGCTCLACLPPKSNPRMTQGNS